MPKLTRETFAAPCPREKLCEKKRGKHSRTRHTKAWKSAKKHKKRSESSHGGDDIKEGTETTY